MTVGVRELEPAESRRERGSGNQQEKQEERMGRKLRGGSKADRGPTQNNIRKPATFVSPQRGQLGAIFPITPAAQPVARYGPALFRTQQQLITPTILRRQTFPTFAPGNHARQNIRRRHHRPR
jgi:hypothetical protein